MKIIANFSLWASPQEVDLEHFGYAKSTKWVELSEEQQIEITDSLVEGLMAEAPIRCKITTEE